MRIFVDADACPVVKIIEKIAKRYKIGVTLLCDTNHILNSDYSDVRVIGAGTDAVDFALVNMLKKGDVAVTQDYGLAAMVLSKGAHCIHHSGKIFTDDNIEGLLMDRHRSKKARMSKSKHHIKGPKKRTEDDNQLFEEAFEKMIAELA